MEIIVNNIASGYVWCNKLYCVSGSLDSLIKIDMQTFTAKHIFKFNSERMGVHRELFGENEMLFCVSLVGISIFAYDCISKEFECYEISGNSQKNIAIYKENDMLWIFPKEISGKVVKFSILERKFEEDVCWCENVRGKSIKGEMVDSFYNEGKFYSTIRNSNNILKYNVITGKLELISIPIEEKLCSIIGLGNRFYLTTKKGNELLVWQKDNHHIERIVAPIMDNEKKYIRVIVIDDKIILMTKDTLDILDDTGIKKLCTEEIETYYEEGSLFFSYIRYQNKFYLLPVNAKGILEISNDFRICIVHKIQLPFEEFVQTAILCKEDETMQVESFIEGVKHFTQAASGRNLTISSKIYEELKNI